MRGQLSIFLAGKPEALDRARHYGHYTVDTEKNRYNKALIHMKAEEEAKRRGYTLPLPSGMRGYSFRLYIYAPIPASFSKRKRAEIEDGERLPLTKPDIDNIAKLWLDGMKGVIEDDSRVTRLIVEKHYAENPQSEGVLCSLIFGDKDFEAEDRTNEMNADSNFAEGEEKK